MTTTPTPTPTSVGLALDGPLAAAHLSARMERGRRAVRFELAEPGNLYRNAYERAWLDIEETDTWSGEVRWVSTERVLPGGDWARERFTNKGREAIQAVLVPAVNRYGFDRLWTELFTTARHRGGDCAAMADECERRAAWWKARETLQQMAADGLAAFVPIQREQWGREQTVATVGPDHRHDWAPVVAQVWALGEQVGWMTRGGQLMPDEAILRDDRPGLSSAGATTTPDDDEALLSWLADGAVT
jgi:hypothetical protein